ncbi:MAG: BMP family ABC transporter substrate-binding protein [Firmicutes bacterium]|nr:BMP family ABC transporter substrate-binding protein [Bacillota bacterium]
MKKFLTILLALTLVLSLAACGEPTGKRLGRNKTVILVTCEEGQASCPVCKEALAGLTAAEEEFGMAVQVLQPASGEEREGQLLAAAAESPDLVLAGCSVLAEAAVSAAKQYPEVSFAVLDALLLEQSGGSSGNRSNLLGVTFAEFEGAYLAGVLAGSRGQAVTGFVGAEEDASGKAQEAAFKAGLQSVKSDGTVLVSYAGFSADANEAAALIAAQKKFGAEVFFAASPYADGSICDFGVQKNYGAAVQLVIESALRGEFAGGTVSYGVKEDCVTYADFAGKADAAALERVSQCMEQIKEGTLVVPKGVN